MQGNFVKGNEINLQSFSIGSFIPTNHQRINLDTNTVTSGQNIKISIRKCCLATQKRGVLLSRVAIAPVGSSHFPERLHRPGCLPLSELFASNSLSAVAILSSWQIMSSAASL